MESQIITAFINFGGMGVCTAMLFYLLMYERRQCKEEHMSMMEVLHKHTVILDKIAWLIEERSRREETS